MKFETICKRAVELVKKVAPIDTGNLRYNAINYEFLDADTCIIKVSLDVAPYMPYTNEPWVSPRWKGKPNPNQGWWQEAFLKVLTYLADELEGEITSD